ncbi:MAG: PP2C family protein-serine/threonine phosphatase [Planctomycetota bacterium]
MSKQRRQRKPATGAYTSEFRYEFLSQTATLFRRRFLWFTAVVGGLGLLTIAMLIVGFVVSEGGGSSGLFTSPNTVVAGLAIVLLSTLVYLCGFVYALSTRAGAAKLLPISIGIVVVDGVIQLLMREFDMPLAMGMFGYFISYTVAAGFLPWSVRQAAVPAAGIVGLNAVLLLGLHGLGIATVLQSVAGATAVVPGLMTCWWRQSSRLRDSQFTFIQRRYGEVRRELTDARRIHESMFPAPLTSGEVRFTYRYQPMRQIGGDYLHVANSPTECGTGERLCVVVLDVTGHGIPAALNVNRLYGELARLFGEDPCIAPGEVLRLLNRYVRLTMSTHSVYVTGLAVRVDPVEGVLEYANAGHPPAFHIGVDGRLDQLDSTTFLLGAVQDGEFDPNTQILRFDTGDRLVAYTDGATEAQDGAGRMLGIRGMQGLLSSSTTRPEGDWPMAILSVVDSHRAGPPADDTLIIEIYRPLTAARPREPAADEAPAAVQAEPAAEGHSSR